MNFIKTQKLLTQQAGQSEIHLESVLELMRTYLTELRYHTNTPVDRCPIDNMPQMVANLASVSNDILFVYRTNEKQIQATESRYTNALAKAQNSCGDYYSRIALLDEQIRQEEADLARLEALQEQESNRNAALSKLREKSEALQAQIRQLSVSNPETEAAKLKAQVEDRTAELAQLEAEFLQLQRETSDLSEKITAGSSRLSKIRDEVQAGTAQLEALGQDIQSQEEKKNSLAQQIGQAQQTLRQLALSNEQTCQDQQSVLDEIAEASQSLAREQQVRADLVVQLNKKQSDVAALQLQLSNDQALAQELDNRHRTLLDDQAVLRQQIADREQEIRRITEEGGKVLDQLNSTITRQEQLDRDYADACRLYEEHKQALETMMEKLQQQTQDNAEAEAVLATRSAELAALTETYLEKNTGLQDLNVKIGELENQLQQLQENASRRRAEIAAAEEALKAEQAEADLLLEQQVEVTTDLEAQKTDNQNFLANHLEPVKTQLAELVIQARNDRTQLEELKNSIKLLEDNRTSMAQENAILKLKLKSKQASLDAVLADYDRNKQAVAVLEEDLRVKGSESAALLEKEKELRELLDEKNVARITAELESCNQRLEDDIRRAEQTEKILAGKQRELESLQQQLAVIQAELEECREKENKLQVNYKTASMELDRITSAENRKRCEQLHNQLQLMRSMTEKLTSYTLTPCGESFRVSDHLQEDLSQAEQIILALRRTIREYTAMRQNTLENCE